METRIRRALASGPTYIGLLVYAVGARSARSPDFRRALNRLISRGLVELDVEAGPATFRLTPAGTGESFKAEPDEGARCARCGRPVFYSIARGAYLHEASDVEHEAELA